MNTNTDSVSSDGTAPGEVRGDGALALSGDAPQPEVTRAGFLSMQVCVPSQWTDEQAEAFANRENPAGTTHGWRMRKRGDEALSGCDERVKCEGRAGCVHIMLDC